MHRASVEIRKGSQAIYRCAMVAVLSAICACFAVSDVCAQTRYRVAVEGCPDTLILLVPRNFVPPSTSAEQRRRDSILDRLHNNPYRKARITEVFMADWNSALALPQITVASLGSLLRFQGRVSTSDWDRIKREFLKSSESERNRLAQQYTARLAKGGSPELTTLRSTYSALFEERDNSLVILAESKATIEGIDMHFLTAAKMFYIRKCIAYVTIAVDASMPKALAVLNEYVSQTQAE